MTQTIRTARSRKLTSEAPEQAPAAPVINAPTPPADQAQDSPHGTSLPEDKSTPAPTSAKTPTKADSVLALLSRTEGATLDELVAATGWLPHTTRAALTGLKKKGYAIERSKADGVSRYTTVGSTGQ